MKAAIYRDFKSNISIEKVKDPEPSDHDALIEVKASGLCLSDWHGWMGHDKDISLPHVPGHEFAGVVVAAGKKVKNWQNGRRITVPFVCACGSCSVCHSGNQQVCPKQTQPGFTHWGSFAQYVVVHNADTNLVALPDEIDDVTAASLGCRFATSFRAVVDQAKVSENDWVIVFGCGGVGLSAIMIAKALGARIIAVDINDDALNFARTLGAEKCINSLSEKSLSKAIIDYTDGGANVSLDAIGNADIVFQSISSIRRRAKHIQIGILDPAKRNAAIPMDRVISHELEIIGSHGMQAYRYSEMLEMIKQGRLQPEKLISGRISLADAAKQLPNMDAFNEHGIRVIDRF